MIYTCIIIHCNNNNNSMYVVNVVHIIVHLLFNVNE